MLAKDEEIVKRQLGECTQFVRVCFVMGRPDEWARVSGACLHLYSERPFRMVSAQPWLSTSLSIYSINWLPS
jgi:hypothetical protein